MDERIKERLTKHDDEQAGNKNKAESEGNSKNW
jgi:hypothetical protein